MTTTRKDASIETLRGLACILLVMAHVIGDHPASGLRVPDDSLWRWFVDSLSYLRMPLFTFISGYVYALRPLHLVTDWPRFMQGKTRRLLLPMFVVGTLLAFMQTYGPGVNEPLDIPWYLWNIVPISPFWFIWSIFWVFAVVALIDTIADTRKRTTVLVVVGVVMALANSLLPNVAMSASENLLGFRTALYLGPFFIAGLLASRYSWRDARIPFRVGVVVALVPLIAITQLGVLGLLPITPRLSLLSTAVGVLGCMSLLLTKWAWSPLSVIGSYSFTIYLFHVPAAVATRTILMRAGVDQTTALFIVCGVAGLALPIIIELVLRRNRWTSLFFLGQKVRASVARQS